MSHYNSPSEVSSVCCTVTNKVKGLLMIDGHSLLFNYLMDPLNHGCVMDVLRPGAKVTESSD